MEFHGTSYFTDKRSMEFQRIVWNFLQVPWNSMEHDKFDIQKNHISKYCFGIWLMIMCYLAYRNATHRQVSNISGTWVSNEIVDHSDVACRRCSNYIFILHWTLGFNKPSRETFKFCDLVRLILEILRYCIDFNIITRIMNTPVSAKMACCYI